MKKILAFGFVTLCLAGVRVSGQAGEMPPAWAYPQAPPGTQRPPDDGKVYRLEGSTVGFTATQINDPFAPPDWYPNEHPPMPEVVAHGRRPDVRACGQCHMPHGLGHPESSGIAGLPADYIVEQMHAYREGRRKSSVGNSIMIPISKAATEEEMRAGAEYYSSVKPQKWLRIIESDTVPTTFVGVGNMRFPTTDGKKEPLGQRIIELPEDSEKAELRDSHSSFVAYVPRGSIAKGQELAMTGGDHVENGKIVKGKTVACGVCHGAQLKGWETCRIWRAGRRFTWCGRCTTSSTVRARAKKCALMIPVVVGLSQDDMLNLAAYISSLQP
jgi:cytochrome c553